MTKKNSNRKINFFNLGKDNDFNNILEKKIINEINNIYETELNKFKYI